MRTKSREHVINNHGQFAFIFPFQLHHFSPTITREVRVVTASGPLDFSTDTTKEPKITIGEFWLNMLPFRLLNVNSNCLIVITVERARWSEWSEWSACTTSCGGGARKRLNSNSRFSPNSIVHCVPNSSSRQCSVAFGCDWQSNEHQMENCGMQPCIG